MSSELPTVRSHLSLVLCTVLHAFTHAYGTMLVPLYVMMSRDLHQAGVKGASFVVTIYGVVYNLGSYGAGVLADRFDRKVLLGIGLLGNALAIAGMGLTHQYAALVVLGVLAGLFGTLFHPAANALIPAHYPRSPGMAIGLLGIGSGLGFFAGPQYAGWRAQAASWDWGSISQWQKPCVELGVGGLVVGILFLLVATEARRPGEVRRGPRDRGLGQPLRGRVVALASVLMFRDFAGVATLSLASIYLQKAYGKTVRQAGLIVGLMMLLSVVVNPLAVYFTPGRRRLPALSIILIVGACVVVTTPFWPVRYTLPVLCAFQTMQLTSYAVSDAAMLERVPAAVRGRVVGLFLVIAGTFASLGPWVMGWWTDLLRQRAAVPTAYVGPFALVAAFMLIAAAAPKWLRTLGPAVGAPVSAAEEISPGTMEAVM